MPSHAINWINTQWCRFVTQFLLSRAQFIQEFQKKIIMTRFPTNQLLEFYVANKIHENSHCVPVPTMSIQGKTMSWLLLRPVPTTTETNLCSLRVPNMIVYKWVALFIETNVLHLRPPFQLAYLTNLCLASSLMWRTCGNLWGFLQKRFVYR